MEEHPEAFEDAKRYEKSALEHGSPFTWSQGESLDDLGRPEQLELVRLVLAQRGERRVAGAARQPVHQRQQRVHLDREPAVRRGHVHAARYATELGHEPLLVGAAADVLHHRVAEADVKAAVGERQPAAVGDHRGDAREGGAEAIE